MQTESGILTIRSLEIIPLLVDAVNQLNSKRHIPGIHHSPAFFLSCLLIEIMSDPLASFAGLSLNSRGPKLLAFFADNKLVVNNHALEVLKGIKGPVAVLGMSGSARSGNSSLCNWLLQQGLQPSFPIIAFFLFFAFFLFLFLHFIIHCLIGYLGEAGHFRTGSNIDLCTKGINIHHPSSFIQPSPIIYRRSSNLHPSHWKVTMNAGIWMSVPEEQTNGSYRIVLDSQGTTPRSQSHSLLLLSLPSFLDSRPPSLCSLSFFVIENIRLRYW